MYQQSFPTSSSLQQDSDLANQITGHAVITSLCELLQSVLFKTFRTLDNSITSLGGYCLSQKLTEVIKKSQWKHKTADINNACQFNSDIAGKCT